MSRKELYSFDQKLNDQLEIDRILIRKRGFYVYYNKPNRERKPLKIHHHTCGECCYGIGKITKAEPGRNGVWIGPAYSIESLQIIIQDILGAESSLCSCCQIKST
jgi:hypothetical protein